MRNNKLEAPGAPGIKARWISNARFGLSNAINAVSKIAFTLSHGILNEVYYPYEEIACIRDMSLIVIDWNDFFSDEERHTRHQIKTNSYAF